MIAIVLAAGYATRMYPLTKNYPKPLLLVNGKPIIEYLTDELSIIKDVKHIYIVTNGKFHHHFVDWSKTLKYSKPVEIINDYSLTNEDRLGALKDVQLVLSQIEIPEAAFILAADNLVTFKLNDLINQYKIINGNVVYAKFEDDLDKLRKTGVAKIIDNQIISFEEKPKDPKGHHAIPPFYIYNQSTLERLSDYTKSGKPTDAPGSFIAYVIENEPVYVIPMNGQRYDVGDLDAYNFIRSNFKK